jgi:hypothetical protein
VLNQTYTVFVTDDHGESVAQTVTVAISTTVQAGVLLTSHDILIV